MSLRINGRTQLAGVIGWPLGHTLSPAMHNAVYEELGLNWVYIPLPMKDEADLMRFMSAARILPFVGFNITMPFKHLMLEMCDEVAMMAKIAGAVNAVHVVDGRFIGYNTDGRGLVEALEADADFHPEGKDIVIIGAGGAAGAACVSLTLAKASNVTIASRRIDRAEEVVSRIKSRARVTECSAAELSSGAEEAVRAADLVINATPLGMKDDDDLPIPADWLGSGQLVVDMIYRDGPTKLVSAARERGATAIDGIGMLVAQGATAVDIWSESAQIKTPREVMRTAVEEALAVRNDGGASE